MRQRILNYLLKHLFNAITEDDVLVYRGDKFYVGGMELPKTDVEDIVSGARGLKEMYVWQLLMKDLKNEANKRIYKNGVTMEDVNFGRATLWTVNVIEQKIENLSKL